MRIERLVVPPLSNNVYIVYQDGETEAIVVDVAQGAPEIMKRLDELQLRASMIINTHGHSDHTAEDELLRKGTGARLAISEFDAYRLASVDEASSLLGIAPKPIEPDIQLVGGQEIIVGRDISFKVIHTPGHTEGSICLYDSRDGVLFSGDTLFAKGYGRVDLKGADSSAMRISLEMISKLPPDTQVYPGHGEPTTISEELEWLREIQRNEAR